MPKQINEVEESIKQLNKHLFRLGGVQLPVSFKLTQHNKKEGYVIWDRITEEGGRQVIRPEVSKRAIAGACELVCDVLAHLPTPTSEATYVLAEARAEAEAEAERRAEEERKRKAQVASDAALRKAELEAMMSEPTVKSIYQALIANKVPADEAQDIVAATPQARAVLETQRVAAQLHTESESSDEQ